MNARFPSSLQLVGAGLLAASLILPAVAGAEERVAIQGTTVSLVPAKGFEPAADFSGLLNQAISASLVIVEMPAVAHPQVSKLFETLDAAKQSLARQNVAVARLEQIKSAGGTAPLAIGIQKTGAVDFDKWVMLLKGDRTVMVTVQAPRAAKLSTTSVKAMLSSVALSAEPSLADKLAALPFRIAAAEPFRIVDAIGGSTVLMTAGPLDVDPQGTQPLVIVSYQLSGASFAGQLGAAAEQMLANTRGFEQAKVEKREDARFAGQDGVLLSGTHQGPGGGVRRFAQFMAIGERGRYLRLIATADEARFGEIEPALKTIVDGAAFAERP
jgi:hypothetical protein